jgi:hypothetical protein
MICDLRFMIYWGLRIEKIGGLVAREYRKVSGMNANT